METSRNWRKIPLLLFSLHIFPQKTEAWILEVTLFMHSVSKSDRRGGSCFCQTILQLILKKVSSKVKL